MALSPGVRIGGYEIVAKIGAGAMGEVYRARDPRLGRDVALKVLATSLADRTAPSSGQGAHDERLVRFDREARTLASLNHPHIAHIYGIEETPAGAPEGGALAIVMELVEGEDLAERLARGPIAWRDARSMALEIVDALETAHEHGVIHRDLKPANIRITPDGVVKVLDFGLAKTRALGATGASGATGIDDALSSPTMTSPPNLTMSGAILGTAAYMSPEQARGQPADKRSDVWAFGCVLYEMLTGRRAFPGDDVVETLASILKTDADLDALPADVPPAIRMLVQRCLARHRRERVSDFAAVKYVLQDSGAPLPAERIQTTTPRTAHRERLAWLTAAVLGAAFATALVLALRRPAGREAEFVRLELPGPTDAGWGQGPRVAVSPDGQQLLIAVGADPTRQDVRTAPLYVRSLASATARPLPGTEGARAPFWAPDMRAAGFFTRDKLKTVDLTTGAVRVLCDARGSRVAGAWGTTEIVFSEEGGRPLMRVGAAGGSPSPIIPPQPPYTPFRPAFLPDGRRFTYHFGMAGSDDSGGVRLASLDGGEPIMLVPDAQNAQIITPDWIAFVRNSALNVQRFDSKRGTLIGEPTALAQLDNVDESQASYSGGASLLVFPASHEPLSRLAWIDRNGRRVSWVGQAAKQRNPELAPAGDRVALERTNESGNVDVWVVGEGPERRLTTQPGRDASPLWLTESQVAFSELTTSRLTVRIVRLDGSMEPLADDTEAARDLTSLSPNRQMFLGQRVNGPTNRDVTLVPARGGQAVRSFTTGTGDELQGQFSPDGAWVAYAARISDSEPYNVFVTDFPSQKFTVQISTDGGVQPRWRRDGRELFYLDLERRLTAVAIAPGQAIRAGSPTPLFEARSLLGPRASLGLRAQYDVSADGGRFLVNLEETDQQTRFFTLLNWQRLVQDGLGSAKAQ